MLAISTDGGNTLQKTGKVVLPCIAGGNRDSKIFYHEPTKSYIMVLFIDEYNVFGIFRSDNLLEWKESQRIVVETVCSTRRYASVPTCTSSPCEGVNEDGVKKWVFIAADGLVWDHRIWSLTNHFFPYTEDEVGAKSAIESDFMSGLLASLALSSEARSVLAAGSEVYRAYFRYSDPRQVREELRLRKSGVGRAGRADAGWYQIRGALKARARNADVPAEAAGAQERRRWRGWRRRIKRLRGR